MDEIRGLFMTGFIFISHTYTFGNTCIKQQPFFCEATVRHSPNIRHEHLQPIKSPCVHNPLQHVPLLHQEDAV